MNKRYKGHSDPAKDAPFNFDLEKMKKAVAAPVYRVPYRLSREELVQWMKDRRGERET